MFGQAGEPWHTRHLLQPNPTSDTNDSVERQFLQFLQGTEGKSHGVSRWLRDESLQVYVRRSLRLVEGSLVRAVDIATIVAETPGQGRGSRFLRYAQSICPAPYLWLESVLNPRFAKWLERQGWIRVTEPGSLADDCPSFVWPIAPRESPSKPAARGYS